MLRTENLHRKEQLCSLAESMSASSDLKVAIDRIKALQAEWKTIEQVPKEQNQVLWNRFRRVCDQVFEAAKKERDRQAAKREMIARERMINLRKKEQLCFAAETLVGLRDTRVAIEQVKELQAQWKEIGSVPKEHADSLWGRFRNACDRVFQNARAEKSQKQEEWRKRTEEREQRQAEWRMKAQGVPLLTKESKLTEYAVQSLTMEPISIGGRIPYTIFMMAVEPMKYATAFKVKYQMSRGE